MLPHENNEFLLTFNHLILFFSCRLMGISLAPLSHLR